MVGVADKGKPAERRGRKATGLHRCGNASGMAAELPTREPLARRTGKVVGPKHTEKGLRLEAGPFGRSFAPPLSAFLLLMGLLS